MRGLGFFILVFFYVLAAWGENSEEPKVTIVSPRDTEVLSSGAVTFEVSIEGIQVPQGGKALVIINEVVAFESTMPRITAQASLEPGVHTIRAMLVPGGWQGSSKITTASELPPTEVRRPWLPGEPGRVSVIIASHDRFDMLLEAVASVKQQTYEDWEIIVVNDASTDSRYYMLIEDVLMIHLPYNIGRPGLVRNVGVSAASGEYVAFLDDDDVWLPRKLELHAMHSRRLNLSCSDAFAGNGTFSPTGEYKRWLRDFHGPYAVREAMGEMRRFGAKHDVAAALDAGHCFHEDHCLPDELDWNVLIRANFVITSSVLVRRDTLFAAGPFNNATLGEDHALWKDLMRVSPAVFVREPLVYWRVDSPDKLTQSWKT